MSSSCEIQNICKCIYSGDLNKGEETGHFKDAHVVGTFKVWLILLVTYNFFKGVY